MVYSNAGGQNPILLITTYRIWGVEGAFTGFSEIYIGSQYWLEAVQFLFNLLKKITIYLTNVNLTMGVSQMFEWLLHPFDGFRGASASII